MVGAHDPADPASTHAQVTIVPVNTLPATADVATAVGRAPGVVVDRLGGLGDLAQVGIRGASARQVEVLLDGIPLNPEGGSAVDLSHLSLAGLGRVEVYRGLAPIGRGSGALGGVVNLVTADAGSSQVTLSGGSYGTARGAAVAGGETAVGELWGAADAWVTQGDFAWYDTAGTALNAADDQVQQRENNDARQVNTLARWRRGQTETLQVTALHAGLWRDEGIPGFTFAPTVDVSYAVQRHLGVLEATRTHRLTRVTGRVHGLVRTESLRDLRGEIGVGSTDTTAVSRSAGAQVATGTVLGAGSRLDLAASATVDRTAQTDHLLADRRTPGPGRVVGRLAAGFATGPADGDWVLTPSVLGLGLPSGALVLPRVGGRVRLGPSAALKGNAGFAARPPDLVELFGDRGTLLGNPDLRAERGASVDAGVLGWGEDWRVEAVVFHRGVRDLIVFGQTPQGVARAENVDRVQISGLETALAWTPGPVEWDANAALTAARDRSDDPTYRGNLLPAVAALELGSRAAVAYRGWRLGTDVSLATPTWADRANVFAQPTRLLWGATLSWQRAAWAIEADVRNLADHIVAEVARDPLVADGLRVPAAVVDLSGYPLPGRTVMLMLRFQP